MRTTDIRNRAVFRGTGAIIWKSGVNNSDSTLKKAYKKNKIYTTTKIDMLPAFYQPSAKFLSRDSNRNAVFSFPNSRRYASRVTLIPTVSKGTGSKVSITRSIN